MPNRASVPPQSTLIIRIDRIGINWSAATGRKNSRRGGRSISKPQFFFWLQRDCLLARLLPSSHSFPPSSPRPGVSVACPTPYPVTRYPTLALPTRPVFPHLTQHSGCLRSSPASSHSPSRRLPLRPSARRPALTPVRRVPRLPLTLRAAERDGPRSLKFSARAGIGTRRGRVARFFCCSEIIQLLRRLEKLLWALKYSHTDAMGYIHL